MGSVVLVVIDVLIHQALQMAIIENDHMVEQIPAAVADPSFGNTILPGTLDAGSFGLNPEAPYRLNNAVTKVRATVEDQVARRGIIGKRFAQLLRYPCASWMPGDVEMQNLTPTVGNNEEAIEHAKGERRNCEEIHGRYRFAVVGQECRPPLCGFGNSRGLPHPVQHCSFRDIKAKHPQFAMNPRRTPSGILR